MSIVVILWTLINLAGVIVTLLLIREASIDLRILGMVNGPETRGKQMMARANLRRGWVRLLVLCGFLAAAFTSVARLYANDPGLVETLRVATSVLLLFGAGGITLDAVADWRMRRRYDAWHDSRD